MKKSNNPEDLKKFFFEMGLTEQKRGIFEIVDIDIPIEEIILCDSFGDKYAVDLRGEYFEMAKKWKNGQKIKAALTHAKSRYTPGITAVFSGKVENFE